MHRIGIQNDLRYKPHQHHRASTLRDSASKTRAHREAIHPEGAGHPRFGGSKPPPAARLAALLLLLLALPLMLVNALVACLQGKAPLQFRRVELNATRTLRLAWFRCGWCKPLPQFYLIVNGTLDWLGDDAWKHGQRTLTPGASPALFSIASLQALSGIDRPALAPAPCSLGATQRAALLLRYFFAWICYSNAELSQPDSFELFGLRIDNCTLQQASDKVLGTQAMVNTPRQTTTACFVNVNSFNLARQQPALETHIQAMDYVFADGSGVRLAARRAGFGLRSNVNGTDLLPVICGDALAKRRSLYLFGAAEGLAKSASANLRAQFPGLDIAGWHHGFVDLEQCDDVIAEINRSGADVVLIGLGSPLQEAFIHRHKDKFEASCLLAVGGLFDFFSGRLPRAPLWLRELGLEWVWRLIQEPRNKFNRYVIGNPRFLFNMYREL